MAKSASDEMCIEPSINVKITDMNLTPSACSTIVNEIIKSLIYQKMQIPYPYNWLKNVINKKRQESDIIQPHSLKIKNHYRIVSTAYNNLETIMEGLKNELNSSKTAIQEIVILFGTIPQCPSEVYILDVSNIRDYHLDGYHFENNLKHQQKTLRNIMLSQEWIDVIDAKLPCSNMYIYLKKFDNNITEEETFIPCKPVYNNSSSKKLKRIRINFQYENGSDSCCNNFKIFNDNGDHKQEIRKATEEGNYWFQCRVSMKGFKDCYINKTSASQLW